MMGVCLACGGPREAEDPHTLLGDPDFLEDPADFSPPEDFEPDGPYAPAGGREGPASSEGDHDSRPIASARPTVPPRRRLVAAEDPPKTGPVASEQDCRAAFEQLERLELRGTVRRDMPKLSATEQKDRADRMMGSIRSRESIQSGIAACLLRATTASEARCLSSVHTAADADACMNATN